MRCSPALLALTAIVVAGCSRVSTETKLNADGSFTRTVKYSAANMGQAKTKIEQVFQIPGETPGVTVTRGTDDMGENVSVERHVAANAAPLSDIVVKDQAGVDELASTVSVTPLPNGNLEYKETLHWLGAKGKGLDGLMDLRTTIKQSLPERFRKTETIDKVTSDMANAMVQILLGPPDPLVFAMMNPDVMQYRLKSRIEKGIYGLSALQKDMPGVTPAEVAQIEKSLADSAAPGKMAGSDLGKHMQGGNSDDKQKEAMSTLTFAVDYPGKIVSTNGIVDGEDGLVYWSLMDVAVESGDVVLDLVVNPKGSS